MDFSFSDDQQALAGLARRILADLSSHERLRGIERGSGPRFDAVLWKAFADAGLLGVPIAEAHGGGGLGFLEVAMLCEEIGRTSAAIPLWETLVLAALPIAEFGSDAQRVAWLPRVAAGDAVLTAAWLDIEGESDVPFTRALRDGDDHRLHGTKICVPAGQIAHAFLVSARDEAAATRVFLVDARASGLGISALQTTAGMPDAQLVLDGVRVRESDSIGGARGAEVLAWSRLRATAGLAAMALGACAEALRLTAEYVKTRKQFDQPLALFQSVGHRAADAFIDVEAIRLTSWQACWRIAEGLEAEREVAVAKYFAAAAGQRVVHTAQHLHGGIGVDRDYPLHRCFLWMKELELRLGGATAQLRRLGRALVA